MKKALKTAARGTVFPYAGEKWVVLEHDPAGRTLCLRLEVIPDKPFDEDNRTVAMENFFQPVCDGDNRLSSFMKRAQHIKQLAASLGVEHSSRFIEYKTRRVHRERSGDRETLFLAAGKRIGRLLALCEKAGGTQGIFDAE